MFPFLPPVSLTLAVLVEKFAAIVVDTGGKSGLPWIATHTPPSPQPRRVYDNVQ
jgi:hypothetical protein